MNPDAEGAWTELQDDAWTDDKAHERFLLLADAAGELAEAGRRYRAAKEAADRAGDAERKARADRQLERIVALAMARMARERTTAPVRRGRLEWVLYGLSAMLLVAALWNLARAF